MLSHPAPTGYVTGDPGVTWDIAAAAIVTDWQRAAIGRRFAGTLRLTDPATSPQELAKYGLTRAALAERTQLLRRARRGDRRARRLLRERYACTVLSPRRRGPGPT